MKKLIPVQDNKNIIMLNGYIIISCLLIFFMLSSVSSLNAHDCVCGCEVQGCSCPLPASLCACGVTNCSCGLVHPCLPLPCSGGDCGNCSCPCGISNCNNCMLTVMACGCGGSLCECPYIQAYDCQYQRPCGTNYYCGNYCTCGSPGCSFACCPDGLESYYCGGDCGSVGACSCGACSEENCSGCTVKVCSVDGCQGSGCTPTICPNWCSNEGSQPCTGKGCKEDCDAFNCGDEDACDNKCKNSSDQCSNNSCSTIVCDGWGIIGCDLNGCAAQIGLFGDIGCKALCTSATRTECIGASLPCCQGVDCLDYNSPCRTESGTNQVCPEVPYGACKRANNAPATSCECIWDRSKRINIPCHECLSYGNNHCPANTYCGLQMWSSCPNK